MNHLICTTIQAFCSTQEMKNNSIKMICEARWESNPQINIWNTNPIFSAYYRLSTKAERNTAEIDINHHFQVFWNFYELKKQRKA